jgi:hypothetical protein
LTPTPSTNYFAPLTDNDDSDSDDDDITITTSNISGAHNLHCAHNVILHHKQQTYQAISDTGVTAHFLTENAPAINIKPAITPLHVTMPNGNILTSTHTCNLDIPWLPAHVTEAHIIPGLSHSSLIAARKFCDKGYKIVYTAETCTVSDPNDRVILTGKRDDTTGLWHLPVNPQQHPPDTRNSHSTKNPLPNQPAPPNTEQHAVYNVYTIPYLQNRLKYMHQAMFCPPITTLINAANEGFLQGFPFMTQDLISKHLVKTPATAKGRMKKAKAGIRSTRHLSPHSNPPPRVDTHNIFCYATLADKMKGTIYTNSTGALPARLHNGNQYFFIAYAYDPNYIYALPIQSGSSKHIIDAFETVFNDLTAKGHKPVFNVTDNQAAAAIKTFLNEHDCAWQIVEPHNHRVNAAERAIQTFKNHFISGLCTTDQNLPFQLWDQLARQAEITCNLLWASRLNPHISAYQELTGKPYDWNAHP